MTVVPTIPAELFNNTRKSIITVMHFIEGSLLWPLGVMLLTCLCGEQAQPLQSFQSHISQNIQAVCISAAQLYEIKNVVFLTKIYDWNWYFRKLKYPNLHFYSRGTNRCCEEIEWRKFATERRIPKVVELMLDGAF